MSTIWINNIIPYKAVRFGIYLRDASGENDGSNFVNDGDILMENLDG
jgi:hypothetical protein